MKSPYSYERIICPVTDHQPRFGEGSVVTCADGSLLLIYSAFTNSYADHGEATLKGLISYDAGRTWCDEHTVQSNIGGLNVMSVSLVRLATGEILMSFLKKDRSRSQCTPFTRISADEGRTWSEPKPVVPVTDTYFVVCNDRLIELRDGRILMPASLTNDLSKPNAGCMFYSDDAGRNWCMSKQRPFLSESLTGMQEPGVVELRDGRVMMWCRSDMNTIHRCYSTDRGETFGPWTSMGLKSPLSPAIIKCIPGSGDLLCIFNNHEIAPDYWAVERSPLTAAISRDDGETWQVMCDLESDRRRAYCYVSITFLPDREVLLTYYCGRLTERVEDGAIITFSHKLAHLKVGVLSLDRLCK